MDPTRVAYADESSWNEGRYRSVCAVAVDSGNEKGLSEELDELMLESGVSEFSWKKLRTAKYGFAASKLIDFTFRHLRDVRVHVLVWDTHDRRHKIVGRDDVANLERMYYRLFSDMIGRHGGVWTLRPDEHSSIDWHQLSEVMSATARRVSRKHPVLEGLMHRSTVRRLWPCESSAARLLQLADLFGGLTVFSYQHFNSFESWCREDQSTLLGGPVDKLSETVRQRCAVLADLDRRCKAAKLRVSLRTNKGLRSMDGRSPLNFWPYIPQHDADRAPTRRRGTPGA